MRLLLAATLSELAIPALIVTHDLGDILALASRVAVMDAGRIVACTGLAEARRSPPNPFAARLLGGTDVLAVSDGRESLPSPGNMSATARGAMGSAERKSGSAEGQ